MWVAGKLPPPQPLQMSLSKTGLNNMTTFLCPTRKLVERFPIRTEKLQKLRADYHYAIVNLLWKQLFLFETRDSRIRLFIQQ